jgi:hypothetical protein
VVRARKRRKHTEVKPGEGIQGIPQSLKPGRGQSQLFTDGTQYRAHPWRLRIGDLKQAIKASLL